MPISKDNSISTTDSDFVTEWWADYDVLPSSVSRTSQKKVKFTCPANGHTFVAPIKTVVKYKTCYVCSGKILLPGTNDFATMNPERVGNWDHSKNSINPSDISAKSRRVVHFVCNAGHEFSTQANSVTRGHWCRYCAGIEAVPGDNDILTTSPDIMEIWDYDKNTIDPKTIKRGSHVKVWFKCDQGHSWEATVHNVGNGTRCPSCAGNVLTSNNSLSLLRPDLRSEWATTNTVEFDSVHIQSNKYYDWVCSEGHTWSAPAYSRTGKASTGCPTCFKSKASKSQVELTEFIKRVLPDGVEVLTDYVGVCSGKQHVDIYIPSMNIAFEYNGLYWHSTAPGIRSTPIASKERACRENGVNLYAVWEDDWINKRGVVEKWIRMLLGVSDLEKINARDCTISEVSKDSARKFLDDHHIQGNKDGSIRVGLFYDNLLVGVSVFTRINDNLTLDRFATNAHVRGGFSKIMAWVDRNVDYSTCVTFADLLYSKGGLYSSTGWTRAYELSPDYYYRYNDRRVHKFGFRVSTFRDKKNPDGTRKFKYEDGLSESELATLNNIWRVWDAGKIKYVRDRPAKYMI